LSPTTKICAMIKADAYGHGAKIVADTLTNFSFEGHECPAVDALAVATMDEAWALGSVPVPVHVLRPVENVYIGRERQRLEMASREGWILTLGSVAAAGDLARIALSCEKRLGVQIMIDTGFGREGMAIAVYGIDPRGGPSMDRPLRPVMKWVAPLLMIRDVAKGVGVGYGQTWTSNRDTRVGLVPVGYGDGYLRAFSNRAKMIVHGRAV